MTKFIILFIFAQLMKIRAEEGLLWWSPDKSLNFIAPNYLPESKKENRRMAVVVDSEYFRNQIYSNYFI